jgi:peptidoglycan-associated lipoprotein
MSKLVLIAAVSILLGACSSPMKMDPIPVEDKSGSAISQIEKSKSDTVGKNAVATVEIPKTTGDAAVPATTRLVYFDYDSFAIRPEFQSVIEAHAKFIKSDRNRKVVIEGHTDERGGREYNLALGQKRAEAVRKALSLLGVAEPQIEAVSFGKEKPAVIGSSEAAMEKNRRAEISYR